MINQVNEKIHKKLKIILPRNEPTHKAFKLCASEAMTCKKQNYWDSRKIWGCQRLGRARDSWEEPENRFLSKSFRSVRSLCVMVSAVQVSMHFSNLQNTWNEEPALLKTGSLVIITGRPIARETRSTFTSGNDMEDTDSGSVRWTGTLDFLVIFLWA